MMSAFFLMPLLLYRSHKGFMIKFYLRMVALVAARKLYRRVLLILLYVFHFLYLCVHGMDVGVIGSTTVFAVFYMFMDVDKWLHRLHDNKKFFCITAMTTVMFAFTPHLFTLAVTVSFVLLAALFYPSRSVLLLWKNENDRKVLAGDRDILVEYYY